MESLSGLSQKRDIIYGTKYVKQLLGSRDAVRIFGESYGVYLTLMAIAQYPDEWISGVAWGANIDLVKGYNQANSHYKSFYKNFLGGTPMEKSKHYRERSPITHIRNLKTPTLIINSEYDSRIPLEPYLDLMKIAESENLPIKFSLTQDGYRSDNANVIMKNMLASIYHLNNK